jgi:RHS repeat-associated protein
MVIWPLPALAVTHSLAGRVTTDTKGSTSRTYTYDGAGRLTTTVDGATTRNYAYDANTNRCALATSCSTPTFTYDNADRITASPYASAYTYDSHGNTTAYTGTSGNVSATIGYDTYDHATTVNDGTTTVTETLSPSGRVIRRVVTTNATSTVTEDIDYGYAGNGDSPAYSKPHAGGSVTTYLGGMIDVAGTPRWMLGNSHGDIIGTIDAAGAFTAAPSTDEFGIGGTTSDRYGWLGTHQRPSIGGTSGLIRMGVRLYDPKLGRFLETDPIAGGSANDYEYCNGDPINCTDIGGTRAKSNMKPGPAQKKWCTEGGAGRAFNCLQNYFLSDLLLNKVVPELVRRYNLDPSTEGNALRHVMWSALMTYRYSLSFATGFAHAHEVDNVALGQTSQADSNIDAANNFVGFAIGLQMSHPEHAVGMYIGGDIGVAADLAMAEIYRCRAGSGCRLAGL